MKVTIEPRNIAGAVKAPPSKSMTQRAFAGALLHEGITTINNAGNSTDEVCALMVIQQLGATMKPVAFRQILIESNGVHPVVLGIQCGASGLAARMFTPIAALAATPVTINGGGSLLNRPMNGIQEALAQLGVQLSGFNGFVPFTVAGPIHPASISIDGSDSSQLLTGLLFALSSCADKAITIDVSELSSKPYIDMTLDVLARFGKPIAHDNYKRFYIDPKQFTSPGDVVIDVEGDWSGAAFLLVAGAIAGEVTVGHLSIDTRQADKAIMEVLEQAGALITSTNDSVTVKRAPLRSFEFDATHCPDLFPVLAVLAACCHGESYITGVHRLFHKERNRAESISEMLMSFDVPYSIEGDMLCITGVRKLGGTVIDPFDDHRIAMAAAVGALRAKGPVDIMNGEVVGKSYVDFFSDLKTCGANCILA